MKKRILAGLILSCLLLVLAACGEKRTATRKLDWQTAPAYLPEAVPLPVETGGLCGCCTDGENMYILAEERAGEEKKFTLTRASLAEGTAAALPDYRPAEVPEGGYGSITGPVLAPDGTLWVYESWVISYYDLPEDFDEERETRGKYLIRQDDFYHMRQLDPETGRELKMVDLSGAAQEVERALKSDTVRFALDGEGRIYLADSSRVAVLDSKGSILFTLEANMPSSGITGSSGSSLVNLPGGTVAALTAPGGGKRAIRPIDPAARAWGQARYEISSQLGQIYGGTGGFLFFYMDQDKLWAWEPEAEEARELLSLPAAQLESGLVCFAPLEGGRLAALTIRYTGGSGTAEYWYTGNIRLNLLSPTDKLPEKVKLVYGTFGANSSDQAKVNAFNRESEEYYIEIRNYLDGVDVNTLSDSALKSAVSAARSRLYADVAAGNAPDIWNDLMPLELYDRQGIFEDLWPWIENDPDLGRESVMEHVLECSAPDGTLYRVSASFAISTVIACSDVVGDRTSWTLEELLDAYESLGSEASLFNNYMSSRGLLQNLILMDEERYVDMDTGECRFDTEEFKDLLELCSRVPREEDFSGNDGGAGLREGRTLLWDQFLMNPSDILYSEALCAGPGELADGYEAYLNANHIYPTLVDENGNWREKEAMYCFALQDMERSRASGYVSGFVDENHLLAAGAGFGVLEGGGYVSYVGYPTQSGAGSSFYLYDSFAMSASCQHKEAAWAFIRQVLLPGGSLRTQRSDYGDFTFSPGFPVNKADFDASMAPQWFTNKNGDLMRDTSGELIEKPDDYLLQVGYPVSMLIYQLSPTAPQRERFMELYSAIERVGNSGMAGELYEIIQEEAEAYWAGDKSLDDTAAMIQSRASLYVNEQR